MIRFDHVFKSYPAHPPVLEDISFSIQRGEFLFLTGRSGAGKSTLLKLMLAVERPSSGRVILGDQDISRLSRRQLPYFRRKLGVVFQDFKLLPRRTVFENIAFVLEIMGIPRKEIEERVHQQLHEVGLAACAHKRPSSLSGGEKQRVAIARALIHRPLVLLADEPTGNLDPQIAAEIMTLFQQAHARGTTLVIATHDLAMLQEAAYQDCRILHVSEGQIHEERSTSARAPTSTSALSLEEGN
jgi:cell division transport system ATP-binding protein